ncbi:hypothetical protein HZB90_02395, partial [archaeon]|nr:hypothetical protein [archaeon]
MGPNLESLKQTRFVRAIRLDWTDECMNKNARAYNVYRCEASKLDGTGCKTAGSTYTVINSAPLPVSQNYTDTTFIGSTPGDIKYYCYFVQGIYGDMISRENTKPLDIRDALRLGKEVRCISAGMEACFNFRSYYPTAEEFCADEVRSTCDENNTVVPINMTRRTTERVDCKLKDSLGTSYICVGPYTSGTKSGLTECVPTSLCDYCNDPFGLFAYSRSSATPVAGAVNKLVSEIGRAPKREPVAAEKLARSAGLYVPCLPQEFNFCYMDS